MLTSCHSNQFLYLISMHPHTHTHSHVICVLIPPLTHSPIQGWLLLFLLIPMYLPSRKLISWYLTIFLEQSLSSKSSVICDLAKNCQNRVQQCSTHDPRQCEPTYFELKALFDEFTLSPLQPPTGSMETCISLSDGSLHVRNSVNVCVHVCISNKMYVLEPSLCNILCTQVILFSTSFI